VKYDELSRLRLERATDVVQGRIVEVRADKSTVRDGFPVAIAKMKVSSVVKGKIPTGDLTLVTAIGSEACGMAETLLSGVGANREMILGIGRRSTSRNKREYEISTCGYFAYVPR
jgi:hypothetical protein